MEGIIMKDNKQVVAFFKALEKAADSHCSRVENEQDRR